MHKHLIAQSVAEMNPDYKPFKPFLKELYEEVYPRWVGDGCDLVDPDKPYQVIRKYNAGRTPVLPTESLEKLTPIVDNFAWNLWDAQREKIMDQIHLVDNAVPMVSEVVN